VKTFDELGLPPEIVEALVAEGVERPTGLQSEAVPVLCRGTSAVLRAGPGSGLLVCWGPALLTRISPEGGQPKALVLTPERARARELALSLARLTTESNHRIAALGGFWRDAAHSDILFSTLPDLLVSVRSSEVKLEGVLALVLDGASAVLEQVGGSPELGEILQALTRQRPQTVVASDPLTPEIRRWVKEHVRKAVFLPPEVSGEEPAAPIHRGTLEVYTVENDFGATLAHTLSDLVERGPKRVLLFSRSEDRAADTADLLSVQGYRVGSPGEADVDIWLGVDPLEARALLADSEAGGPGAWVVSADVPLDADELDRRHGAAPDLGAVLAYPRELPHLKSAGLQAGYNLRPAPSVDPSTDTPQFIQDVERAIEDEDLAPYLLLLEPLVQRHGAAEVAAALAVLLRRRRTAAAKISSGEDVPGTREAVPSPASRPTPWARLFLTVGTRDGIAPRDLLGAITGEAGIRGDQVGKIEVKTGFSRVEVHDTVADRVLRSLNGTSIRGRSVRADYDRAEGRAPSRAASRRKASVDRSSKGRG
jgi:ATP-dependent RNA helicase DeaD